MPPPSENRIVRRAGNQHRYICLTAKGARTLQTHEDDLVGWIGRLFGVLNGGLTWGKALKRFVGALLLSMMIMQQVQALPTGWQVESGDVNFEVVNGNTLNITSQSQQAIVNYQSFHIAQGESVNFFLGNNFSSILNRILGGGTSSIMGNLSANTGTVILTNPAGINFGATANVNVGSLIASSLHLSSADYLANNWTFGRVDGMGPGAIQNSGNIAAQSGGFVVLSGGAVSNSGNIFAPDGAVKLAVGDRIRLSMSGQQAVEVTIDQSLLSAIEGLRDAIGNTGVIDAHTIELQAKLSEALYERTINNEGVMRTVSATREGASIKVLGYTDNQLAQIRNAGTLDVSANAVTTFDGGELTMEGDRVDNTGNLLARGADTGHGGRIHALGGQVAFHGTAIVDASGGTGGGEVLIGGDFQGQNPAIRNAQKTWVTRDVQIKADATQQGDGGKVIVWADQSTQYYGHISAQGGAQGGDGGLVEVSGKENLAFMGDVDTRAVNGAMGTVLLDPTDINIVDGAGADDAQLNDDQILAADAPATMNIGETKLESMAATSNVVLQANNNITVNNLTDNTLGLAATTGSITLTADADNSGAGTFSMADTADVIRTEGGNITISGASVTLGKLSTKGAAGDKTGGAISVSSRDALTASGTIDTGNGAISLNADSDGSGAGTLTVSANVTSGGGNVTLKGDQFDLNNALDAGSGSVSITASNNIRINVGNATDNGDGATLFDVSNPELNRITAASVTIGDTTTTNNQLYTMGDLDLSGSGAGKFALTLQNMNKINLQNNITLGGYNFTAYSSAGDVQLTSNKDITKTTGGDATLTFKAAGNIILNAAAGATSDLTSSSNKLNVIFNSDSDASGSGAIYLNYVNLTSNSGNVTFGGGADPTTTAARGNATYFNGVNISQSAFTLGAGNLGIRGQGYSIGTSGAHHGINIDGTTLSSTSGNMTLVGTGGTGNSSTGNRGILTSYLTLTTADGAISLTGTGGASAATENTGVEFNYGSFSASGSGGISITGTGTGSGNNAYGVAVKVVNTFQTNTGAISLSGTSNGTGANYNNGVSVDASTINTLGGNIAFTGTGSSTATGIENHGVFINASSVSTTGAGTLSLTGTGGKGTNDNHGVDIRQTSSVSTASGDLTIVGNGLASATGSWNLGVLLGYSSGISSQNGNINITATGGGSSGGGAGIDMWDLSTIQATGTGNISITGTATGSAADSYGIWLEGSSKVIAASGNITLTGTGGGANNDLRFESLSTGTGNVIGANTMTGNITLIGNSYTFSDFKFQNNGGTLTFKPRTASTSIGVAGGAGALSFTDASFFNFIDTATVSPGKIILGDKSLGSGAVNINAYNYSAKAYDIDIAGGSVTLAGALTTGANDAGLYALSGNLLLNNTISGTGNVLLQASGTINDDGATDRVSTSGLLTLNAGGNVGNTSTFNTSVGSLAINGTGAGSISITEANAITINASSATQAVSVIAGGNITTAGAITTTGNLTLQTTAGTLDAAGGNLTSSGDLSLSATGALTLDTAGTSRTHQAKNINLTGSSITVANSGTVVEATGSGSNTTLSYDDNAGTAGILPITPGDTISATGGAGGIINSTGDLANAGTLRALGKTGSVTVNYDSSNLNLNNVTITVTGSSGSINLSGDVSGSGNNGTLTQQTGGSTVTLNTTGGYGVSGSNVNITSSNIIFGVSGSANLSGNFHNGILSGSSGSSFSLTDTASDITTGALTAGSALSLSSITHLTAGGALTSTGALTLIADSDGNNTGSLTSNGVLTSNNNAITLKGAQADINASVNAGSSTVTLTAMSDKEIDVAGATDNADSGTIFDVSSAELGRITAATVTIGDTTTPNSDTILKGALDLSGSGAGKFNLQLLNKRDVIFDAATGITAGAHTVTLTANDDVTLNSGITTSNGAITLTADNDGSGAGALTISGNITSGNANVTLKGDQFDLNNALNAGSGSVSITASNNIRIDVGNATDNNDTATLFDVSNPELNRITAASVTIGDTTTTNNQLYAMGVLNMSGAGAGKFALTLQNMNKINLQNNITLGGYDFTAYSSANNVQLTAGRDITKSAGGDATLTLKAAGNVILDSTVGNYNTVSSSSNKLHVVINSDSDASGSGAVFLDYVDFTTNNGNITIGGGADPSLSAARGNATYYDGVYLNGSLDTGAGNISVRGQGFSQAGTDNHYGINLSAVISTTTGDVSLIGSGGTGRDNLFGIFGSLAASTQNGDITLTGTGGNGTGGNNKGIYLSGSLTTQDGIMTITGTSGIGLGGDEGIHLSGQTISSSTGNISLVGNSVGAGSGIVIQSSTISSADGLISMVGTGGSNNPSAAYVNGISIYNSAQVFTTGTGNITLTGTGGLGTFDGGGIWENNGVEFDGSAQVYTASGTLTITGTAIDGNSADIGMPFPSATSTIGANTMTGDIVMIGNSFDFTYGQIRNNGGNIIFKPRTASTTIGINGGAGALSFTNANFFNYIDTTTASPSKIILGDSAAGTGAVNIATGWDFSGKAYDIDVYGGSITGAGSITTGANNLGLYARTGGLTQNGAITSLGNLILQSNGLLDLNGNIQTTGGNLTLTANGGGNITLDDAGSARTHKGQNVTITATGGGTISMSNAGSLVQATGTGIGATYDDNGGTPYLPINPGDSIGAAVGGAGALTVDGNFSSVGTLRASSGSGDITINYSSSDLNLNNVTIDTATAANGSISILNDLPSGAGDNGTIDAQAGSSGGTVTLNITNGHNVSGTNTNITANNIVFNVAGNSTLSGNFHNGILSGSSGGSFSLTDTASSLNLNSLSAATNLSITAALGHIDAANTLSASNISLITQSNGDITLHDNLTATNNLTLTLDGTGVLTQSAGVLSAQTLSLDTHTSVGSALDRLDTNISNLSATIQGPAHHLFLAEANNLSINASSASGTLDITAAGDITTAGDISADATTLASSDPDGDIALNHNVTGTTSLTITASGTGDITQSAGVLNAGTLALSSTSGDIGTAGNAIDSNATAASLNTSGDAFLSEANNLTINASAVGGTLEISAAGDIATAGAISADATTLASSDPDGDITLNHNVTGTTSLTITASGTGDITQSAGVLNAGTLALSATSGDIGTAGNAIDSNATAASLNTTGDAFLSEASNLTLNASAVGGTLEISAAGDITTAGAISADATTLASSDPDGDISLNHNVTGTTSLTITASGTGDITQSAGVLNAGTLALSSTSGNIGTAGNAIDSNAAAASLNTSGDAFLSEANNLTINASAVGGTLEISAAGDITTAGAISADAASIASSDPDGDITLNHNVTGTTSLTITASGTGDITQSAGTITGGLLTFNSNGGLGTALDRLDINAATLTLNTAGDLFLNETDNITLNAATALHTLDLAAAGNITLQGNLNAADTLTLNSATGDIHLDNGAALTHQSSTISFTAHNIDIAHAGTLVHAIGNSGGASFDDHGGTAVNPGDTINALGAGGTITIDGNFASVGTLQAQAGGTVSIDYQNSDLDLSNVTINAGGGGGGTITFLNDLPSGPANNGTLSALGDSVNVLISTANNHSVSGTGLLINATGGVQFHIDNSLNLSGNFNQAELSGYATNGSFSLTDTASNLNLNSLSAATNLSITAALGHIDAANTLSASNISLITQSNGDITLHDNLTATNNLTLTLDGTGVLTQSAGVLSAQTLSLDTHTSVGSALDRLDTNISNLSATIQGPAHHLFLAEANNLSINASSASGTLDITAAGDITTAGDISADATTLASSDPDGDIALNHNVTGTTSLTITASGTGDITQSAGVLNAGTLALSSTSGDIGTAGNAIDSNATAASLNTTGDAFLSEANNLTINASAVGGTLQIAAAGDIATAGAISADAASIASSDPDGDITLNHNVTGTTSLTITASGTGDITQSAGVLNAGTLALSATSGDIGTAGNAIDSNATAASLNTTGDAFLSEASNLTLNASAVGGTLEISAAGDITTAGAISADTASIASSDPDGDITLNHNVTGTTSLTISASGTGDITQSAGVLNAGTLALSATSGNIGTAGNAIDSNAAAASLNTSGDAFLSEANNLTINASAVGGTLEISAAGDIATAGAISADTASIASSDPDGDITLNHNVTGTTSLTITASGTGDITQSAGTITGGLLTFNTNGGLGTALDRLDINAATLTLNTTGDLFLNESDNITLNAATALHTLDLAAAGNITLQGNLNAADTLTLNSATGDIHLDNGAALTHQSSTISFTAHNIDIAHAGTLVHAIGNSGGASFDDHGGTAVNPGDTINALGAGGTITIDGNFASVGTLQAQAGGTVSIDYQNSDLDLSNVTINAGGGGGGTITFLNDLPSGPANNGTLSALGDSVNVLISTANNHSVSGTGLLINATGGVQFHIDNSLNLSGNFNQAELSGYATNGSFSLTDTASNINLNSLSAATNLSITAALGHIDAANTLSASNISLITQSNGDITLHDNLTATNNLTLTLDGTGVLTQSAGVLSAQTLSLDTHTSVGSALDRLDTNISNLSATIQGPAHHLFLAEANNLSINASSASGTLDITAAGDITTAGDISADATTLASSDPDGDIALNHNVTGTTSLTITASGTGDITQSAGVLNAGTLALSSTSGDIGTAGNAIDSNATAASLNTSGDAFLSEANNLTINASAVGGTLQIAAAGDIATAGAISADAASIASSDPDGDITLNHNVTGTTSLTITASGTGDITQSAGVLNAGTLALSATSGDIGTAGNAIDSNATAASLNTTGDAFLSEASNLTLNASAVGGTLEISAAGDITTAGAISADTTSLASSDPAADITLYPTVTVTTSLTISASGTGYISRSAGVLNAGSLALSATFRQHRNRRQRHRFQCRRSLPQYIRRRLPL
ncbi:MAG: filamentous hemagglutinin N-terminal domain-containing protein [Vampirovibrionales bacterium]|nr:filamentous hemagglutinin N-terminal domain-containing protein [Vampirovibrionales bacterium]